MKINLIEYLDEAASKFPNKIGFEDGKGAISYKELQKNGKIIGCNLMRGEKGKPVVVFLEKGIEEVACFMGILYSGNYYCPLDVEMPVERIIKILNTLKPQKIITDNSHVDLLKNICIADDILIYEELLKESFEEKYIQDIKCKIIDVDPAYVLFTSGSTGVPKGVIISHGAVIDYVEWITSTFNITENDRLANQTPFHFSMSVFDIYVGLRNCATVYIIPKEYFVFPINLVRYLNEKRITTIYWVPSVFNILARLRVFSRMKLETVNKILFSGEVMHNKILNYWRKNYPNALYANLYGPTEVTDVCAYYIVNREFDDDDPLPIGIACRNKELILLSDDDGKVNNGGIGEICVRGRSISYGYYRDFTKSNEVIKQNPLNTSYRDFIYRTGDLGQVNEYGEILYKGRKDFQIKYMGHRIELGEIEIAATGCDFINVPACIYDNANDKIVLFYSGELCEDEHVKSELSAKVPEYMIPAIVIYLEEMPYNNNGKIDRKKLMEDYKNGAYQ